MKLLIAVTGASGIPLSVRLLETLGILNIERHLAVSNHAKDVQKYEQNEEIIWENLCEKYYSEEEIYASVCSGSYKIDGMIILPCSMNTLGHIANGIENSLITRAAAVNIKQERPVILVPRETPLSLIHIENMKKAKMAGCTILIPTVAFYFSPKTINDIINHIIGKILEILNISHNLYKTWEN